MKRIQIVGPSGSGKTTLGVEISKKLNLPHIEMDLLFWLPEWKEKPKKQYMKDVKHAIAGDAWVLCGNYFDRTEGLTLQKADTIIWLHYPKRIYLTRMTQRTVKRLITREKLWGHSRERALDFFFRPKKSLFWITVRLHNKEGDRRYAEKLQKYNFTGEVLEFTSPKETAAWLSTL